MDFIISSVLSFLTELEVDAFTGFKGKIRKTLIKRKLKFSKKDGIKEYNIKIVKERLGHTPLEVLAGVLIGIIIFLIIPN